MEVLAFFKRLKLRKSIERSRIMKPYERVRHLRKRILHMTLEEFSQKINMSRSNLGNIETGRICLTERVLSDICRTFLVNPDWIASGSEPVFQENKNPLDVEIMKLYSSLTEENKKYLYGYMQRLLDEQENEKD